MPGGNHNKKSQPKIDWLFLLWLTSSNLLTAAGGLLLLALLQGRGRGGRIGSAGRGRGGSGRLLHGVQGLAGVVAGLPGLKQLEARGRGLARERVVAQVGISRLLVGVDDE